MQYRLRRHEKETIRKQYKDNLIYKAFAAPCKKYEALPKGFKLSPEELFWECMIVLDDIKESPEDARFQLQDFWNGKVVDYEDLSSNMSRKNIELAASMVTMCVAICLNGLELSLYNTLTSVLISQLQGEESSIIEMRESFTANIYRLGEDKFNSAVAEYMDSDVFESEDIVGILEELPVPAIRNEEDEKSTDGQYEQLTNRQLMLFVDYFVNAGFKHTKETPVNVSAYSKLLGLISGKSPDSIRDKMKEGIDYDSQSVKDDIKYLAELLKPVKKDLAEKFLQQI